MAYLGGEAVIVTLSGVSRRQVAPPALFAPIRVFCKARLSSRWCERISEWYGYGRCACRECAAGPYWEWLHGGCCHSGKQTLFESDHVLNLHRSQIHRGSQHWTLHRSLHYQEDEWTSPKIAWKRTHEFLPSSTICDISAFQPTAAPSWKPNSKLPTSCWCWGQHDKVTKNS